MAGIIQSSFSKMLGAVEAGVGLSQHIKGQKEAEEQNKFRTEVSKSKLAINKAELSLKEALTARIESQRRAQEQMAKISRSIQRQKLQQQKIITEKLKGEK